MPVYWKTPRAPEAELKARPYCLGDNLKTTRISSQAPFAESGCMQITHEYLWPGNLGSVVSSLGKAEFSTEFSHSGTKEINLVVVTPSSILAKDMYIVDVR